MTEQEFRSRSFKHSQPYDWINPRTKERVECLLTAVDFDAGTIRLWPIPLDKENFDYKEVWVSYEYCFPPLNKLKKVEQ